MSTPPNFGLPMVPNNGGGGTPASPVGSVQYNAGGAPNVFGGFGIYTPSTHTLQLDAADSATPNSQTIQAQSVAVGTLNGVGATMNIRGSVGTGFNFPGDIAIFTGFFGIDLPQPVSSISQASPAVITTTSPHHLFGTQTILLATTGTLPAPFAPLTTYFVDSASLGGVNSTTFQLAATLRGTPINTTSAGSGTHSYVVGSTYTVSGGTFTAAGPHGMFPGMQVQFQTTGTLPPPLQPNTNYFIVESDLASAFQISATNGGSIILTSGAGTGTQTYQVQGGTVQNVSPVNSIFIGPGNAYNFDATPCMKIVQNWNTANVPSGGLSYNITNLQFSVQDTVFNTFVPNLVGATNLDFVVPAGGNSWRIRHKSPHTGYLDFNINNTTTISGAPVAFTAASQYPAQTTQTGNYSHALTDRTLVFNGAGSITLTLLAAVTYPGLELWVKTIANQAVVSATSNVIPQVGGAAGTAILAATAGKFALLKSNGANWEIIASN